MDILRLDKVSKSYPAPGRPVDAVRGLSAVVPRGGGLGFYAYSGGGKTTALRLIAGLERPDAGAIYLADRIASGNGSFIPPRERNIGMVFQGLALWPHMSAQRQVDFVLKESVRDRKARKAKLDEWFEKVGLAERRRHKPADLSYGEAQRVALLRALAGDPAILLLDEPFAYLDSDRRANIVDWIADLKGGGLTVVLASHRPADFERLCDSVVVMNQWPYATVHPAALRESVPDA